MKKAVFHAWVRALMLVGFADLACAHCPDKLPVVKMTFPAPGISVQEAYWEAFDVTFIDTFYQAKLKSEMTELFRASRFAMIAVLDTLVPRVYPETSWFADTFFVELKLEESLTFRVIGNLKGVVPNALFFRDTAFYYAPPLSPTTYRSLVGVPFVALFNWVGHVRELGIGPEDGCFFEPTAYMVMGGRIHKKGLEGKRMPGVSVPLDDFLAAVASDSIPGYAKVNATSKNLPYQWGKRKVRRVWPDRAKGP